jgi:hypothetical protein
MLENKSAVDTLNWVMETVYGAKYKIGQKVLFEGREHEIKGFVALTDVDCSTYPAKETSAGMGYDLVDHHSTVREDQLKSFLIV